MRRISTGIEKITVPSAIAEDLLYAANQLPVYDTKDYYSFDLQASIHQQIRNHCSESFDWLINQIQNQIQQAPYFALIKGLQLDDEHRLFVAINRAFGDLVASPFKKPRGQLVHYIHPVTDLTATKGKKYETEKFHTDTADWEVPVKLISMVCVRADQNGGGKSVIIDMDTIKQELRERAGDETVKILEDHPVPWQKAPYRDGGIEWRPVLSESMLCWRRYTIERALVDLGQVLSPEIASAFDTLEEIIDTSPGKIEFLMEEGELLFLDNHRTLHARTPIPDSHISNRFMIRSWIQAN